MISTFDDFCSKVKLIFDLSRMIEQQDHFENVPMSTEQLNPSGKARSRTISENILGKNHPHVMTTSPSSSRTRLHSPSHMPYPLRSPRTMTHMNKQHYQASSPVNIDNLSVSRSSGFHSSFISPSSSNPSSYTDNPIETSQHQYQPSLKTPSTTSTMPIQIPSSNSILPPASLPQLTGIFPITQSHSLPTYILPSPSLAYLATTGPSAANTNMFLIANPTQHTLQPVHILTPIDASTLQFSTVKIDSSANKSTPTTSTENTKQAKEQLPFKKRRHTGQSSPMDMSHFDDDEGSNESMKK